MERRFTGQDQSLVVVSHDRAFMESVCTSVLELDAGEVFAHSFGGAGSYARFREARSYQYTTNCLVPRCQST